MKSSRLPRTDFKADTAERWNGTLFPCRGLWGGYALDEDVLSKSPMRNVRWSTLFAYMYRRFGPPHLGGDDYKDLSAGWMLTTPDQDVFVVVSPSLSGPGFSFRPYFAAINAQEFRSVEELKLPADRVAAIRKAYGDTLADLLRPVCVRDHHINALGELGNSARDETLLAYDEESDELIYEVRFHHSSGYAMPVGLFGGEDWSTLCRICGQLGDGDMAQGRKALIEILQEPVIREASKELLAVKRLMLLGAWKHKEVLAKRLGLNSAEVNDFEKELSCINGQSDYNTAVVDEMSDAAVKKAAGYLERLGLGDSDIEVTVNGFRVRRAIDQSWQELESLAKDGFPSEALPRNSALRGVDLADALKAGFAACDRSDLVAWVARTYERAGGVNALEQIAFHLLSQTNAQAKQ